MNLQDAPLRIAIQERQRFFREGLELVLDRESDLSVVCTASTAVDLVMGSALQPVDLALVELDAPDWDLCWLVASLRERHPGLAVVGTVGGSDPRLPARAVRAGIHRVFARDTGVQNLLQTIRSRPDPSARPDRVVYLDEHRPVRPVREAKVLEMFGAQVIGIHRKSDGRGFTPSVA
jgi:DNA-binding NtrC family response regulator